MANATFGPMTIRMFAEKCYREYVVYRAAAGFPSFSLYIPRDTLPADNCPYQIEVALGSTPKTHWREFKEDCYFDRL